MFALAILGLLTEEPLHGYEIRKQLSDVLGVSGAISFGSLYPTLAKLHRQGLIDTATDTLAAPTKKQAQIFSTGSLSGDMAFGARSPLSRSSSLMGARKKKKVYSITDKGREAFADKLHTSIINNADDDRAFVAHLAFISLVDESEFLVFTSHRISALRARLEAVPQSHKAALAQWHDVQREYIHQQISFLESLRSDAKTV